MKSLIAKKMLWHALDTLTRPNPEPLVWDLNILAVNRCNQNCPMCNAGILTQRQTQMMSVDAFCRYADMLANLEIPVCTISGGEPTLVPDMPAIIAEAAQRFPQVMLISNFYTKPKLMLRVAEAILRNNARIICSFDGFGEVADRLRGAPDVSDVVCQNLELVTELKQELRSESILEIHTVISDDNLSQVDDMLALSARLGWVHTVAPRNSPAQMPRPPEGVGLTPSEELDVATSKILRAPNVTQLHSYIKGIPLYAEGTYEKFCPYLTPGLRTMKVFLEPNGDVSLCDRTPIGNLNTASLTGILQGSAYRAFIDRAEACRGCWLSCFTEPALAVRPTHVVDALRHRQPTATR